jgi:hypothetical protein
MFSTVMAASVSFGQFDFGIVRETADFGISVTLSYGGLVTGAADDDPSGIATYSSGRSGRFGNRARPGSCPSRSGHFYKTVSNETKLMKTILIGLCALGLSAGLISKTAAQTVTIRFSPATDNSYWVWNNGYQCWIWNGSEFEADYQGHPYSRRTGSGTSRRPQ